MVTNSHLFLKNLLLIIGVFGLTSMDVRESIYLLDTQISFSKQTVHQAFISEGVAVADVNNDGMKDILSGHLWFEAPEWTAHELRPAVSLDYALEYSDTFLNYAMDVDFDGWVDLIRFGLPGEGVYWYKNPNGKIGHWSEHLIDSNACNESPMLIDLDENGRMDLVFGHEKSQTMMWFRSPKEANNLKWDQIPLSDNGAKGTNKYEHGLGFGDVNGDGRKDVITRHGWWEAPVNREEVPWNFHEASLGEDCSQMFSFDFDSDGDSDIITASAHNYGVWWHEQDDSIENGGFTEHKIDSTYSQSHGAAFTDLNGDGLPEFITGKRFFAHLGKDPGSFEPAVIYWYELKRTANKPPKWIPHLIDDQSGVGLQLVVEDMNKDGKPDIITANKKGVYCFMQD